MTHKLDANTAALWRLDEEASAYENHEYLTAAALNSSSYDLTAPTVAAKPFIQGGPKADGQQFARYFLGPNAGGGYASLALASPPAAMLSAFLADNTVEFFIWQDVAATTTADILMLAGASPTSETEANNFVFRLYADGSNQLVVFWEHGAGINSGPGAVATIPTNQWVHVAVTTTWTGSNVVVEVFFNGASVSVSGSLVGPTGGSSAQFSLGAQPGSTAGCFVGALADLRISTVVRTPSEIAASCTAGEHANDGNTLEIWRFSEPPEAVDIGPNGWHMGPSTFNAAALMPAIVSPLIAGGGHARYFGAGNRNWMLCPRRADMLPVLQGDEATLEFWFQNSDTTVTSEVLMSFLRLDSSEAEASNAQLSVSLTTPTGTFGLYWEHAGAADVIMATSSPIIPDSAAGGAEQQSRHHVAVVRYPDGLGAFDVDLYLDGTFLEKIGTGVAKPTGGSTVTGSYVWLGRSESGYSFFGRMDDIRLSTVARTAEEILASYEAGLGIGSAGAQPQALGVIWEEAITEARGDMSTYIHSGIVIDRAASNPDPAGLRVEAWDEAELVPDLVAHAITDDDGRFQLRLTDEDLDAIFGDEPAKLYFRVLVDVGGGQWDLHADTKGKQSWDVKGPERRTRILIDSGTPIEAEVNLADFVVRGHITHVDTGPYNNQQVDVYDVRASGDVLLGSPTTNPRGYYELAYDGTDLDGKQLLDLKVSVTVEAGTFSVTRCQAPPTATINLTIDGESYRPSEYDAVLSAIGPALGGATVGSLDDEQIAQVACSSGRSPEEVRALARAAVIVDAVAGVEVSDKIVYGLLRQGLPDAHTALLALRRDVLRSAIQRASDARQIPRVTEEDMAAALDQLRDAAVGLAREAPAEGTTCNLADILGLYVPDTGSSPTALTVFLEQYTGWEGTVAEFWVDAHEKAAEADPGDRYHADLVTAVITDAQIVLQWATLTRYYFPLILRLRDGRAADPQEWDALADLAALDEADWRALLDDEVTPEGGGPEEVGAPADMPGADEEERRDNYAVLLTRTMESGFATRAIAGRTKKEAPGSDLATFFEDNPSFSFESHRVAPFWESADLDNIAEPDRAPLLDDLLAYERLLKLTPRYHEAKALFDAGLKSARAVARFGREGLIERFANVDSGATRLTASWARTVHQRARAQAAAAAQLFASFNPFVSGPRVRGIPDRDGRNPPPEDPKQRDWPTLVGTLDQCGCEHCRSILSPAAYLVDLLNWLKQFLSEAKYDSDTKSWRVAHLLIGGTDGAHSQDGRRPDIARIVLNCKNTFTTLPYIDLTNELLEREVSGAALPARITTTAESEELLATPEIIDPAAHSLAYDTLAQAHYPWRLPFSLWHEEARVFLAHLGVRREDLMETLQRSFRPSHIPGMRAWFRADTGVSLSGGRVSELRDLSGRENHAAQPDATLRPGYGLAGANGQPYVELTGGAVLSVAAPSGLDLAGATIVVIAGDFGAATERWLLAKASSPDAANFGIARKSSGEIEAVYDDALATGPAWTPSGSDVSIGIVELAADHTKWRVDGVETTDTPQSNALEAATQAFHIGARPTGAEPPFDQFFIGRIYEIVIYDGALSTDDAERLERYAGARYGATAPELTPRPLDIAQERLGMSKLERQVIVADPDFTEDPWKLWGFDDAIVETLDWHEHLRRASSFMAASDLGYDELRELLDTSFMLARGDDAQPYLAVEEGFDACDPEHLIISGFDPGIALTDIWTDTQRFIRLQRRLGWGIRVLDKVLAALGPALDEAALERFGDVAELRQRFSRQPLPELASWWSPLDGQPNAALDERAFYEQLFLNRAIANPPPSDFALEGGGLGTGSIRDRLAHVLAVVRMSGGDFSLLGNPAEARARLRLPPALDSLAFNLAELSRVFRLASFARASKLRMADLVTLQALTGRAPLLGDASLQASSPAETRRFLEAVERLASIGLTVPKAHFLVRHVAQSADGVPTEEKAIDARLASLEGALARLVAETTYTDEAPDKTLRALLAKVIGSENPELAEDAVTADVDILMAIIDGTSALAPAEQRTELERVLLPFVPEIAPIRDALTFRPYELGSCEIWLEPSGIADTSGQALTAWTPSAGASVSIASAPVVVDAGPFGLRAVSFDGTDDALTFTLGANTSTSHSFFCIVRQTVIDATGGNAILDAATGRLVLAATTPGAADVGLKGGTEAFVGAEGTARDGEQILAWILDAGTGATVYRDGIALHDTPLAYADPVDIDASTTVGLAGRSEPDAKNFAGQIACAGYFDGAVADDDQLRIHDYLFTLAGRPPTERFAMVERALLDFVRQRDARLLIVQHLANATRIALDVASILLNEALISPADGALGLVDDLLPPTHAATDTFIPATPERRAAVARISKAADVVATLKIGADELRFLQGPLRDPGWLDLNDLPLQPFELEELDTATAWINAGVFELPSWLRLRCPTPNRSARISPTEVRTGFAPDTARAYSSDGTTFGILVEPGAANLVTQQDLSQWTPILGADVVLLSTTTPAGEGAVYEVVDDSASVERVRFDLGALPSTPYTLSAWLWRVPAGGTTSASRLAVTEADTTYTALVLDRDDVGWSFSTVSATAAASPAELQLYARLTAAETGSIRAWGVQLEANPYPTSFIGADNTTFTRAPDVLSVELGASVIRSGHVDLTIVYAPLYAHDEAAGDHDLFFIDADNRLFFDVSEAKVVWRVHGVGVASAALAFAREDVLTVRAQHDASGVSLTVTGAATGNGTTNGAAQAAISWPARAYVLGADTGAQEGAVLYKLRIGAGAAVGSNAAWPGDLAEARRRFEALLRLGDFLSLRALLERKGASLIELVSSTTGAAPLDRQAYLDAVAEAAGWSRGDLEQLAGADGFGLAYADELRSDRGLVPIARAMNTLRRLGVSAGTAFSWTDVNTDGATQRAIAEQTLGAAKANHAEAWREVARPLRDVLREKQRDALVAHILHRDGLASSDDLYDKLLIDTEMSPCQLTSRVQHAISSVQHFVHRILLGLEEEAVLPKDSREEWRWRKFYRVWEANRKVFLWPENWIEPELRDDKTPFFRDLENSLRQGDLDDRSAEKAYRQYLSQLDEVAHLRPVGLVHHAQPGDLETPKVDELHVFAQTFGGSPRPVFHRKWVQRKYWTPWEKVPVEAASRIFVPTYEHGRLSLFWLSMTDGKADEIGNIVSPARLQLHVSVHDGNAWSRPQSSDTASLELVLSERLAISSELDSPSGGKGILLLVEDSGPTYVFQKAKSTIDQCAGDFSQIDAESTVPLPEFIRQRPTASQFLNGDYSLRTDALAFPLPSSEIPTLNAAGRGATVQVARTRWLASGAEIFMPLDAFVITCRPGVFGRRVVFGYFDPFLTDI